MTGLMKREPRSTDVFDRLDRMFDDWTRSVAQWRPGWFGREFEDMIRVDEYRDNGTLVVRAELPGIDPEKDVEVTVEDGMLRIEAERREEVETTERGYVRHELRSGSFSRVLPMPEGVSESDVKAVYKDGILEIRIPMPTATPAKKVEISKG